MATINVLVSSFPGLGLPSTLCIPLHRDSTIADLTTALTSRLPTALTSRLILSTTSNHPVSASTSRLSTLLPLRLTAPLPGGKGGFGSQLRAAGGRMSKRKKAQRTTQEDIEKEHAWSRNLDGRRLRTVAEAKSLAEYLAAKPEADAAEKEEKRKRWEKVVEEAERAKLRIKEDAEGKGRVDGAWAESKEDAEAKVREAVLAAMREAEEEEEEEEDDDEEMEDEEESQGESSDAGEGSSSKATTPESASDSKRPQAQARKVFGWDDDDDEDDEDDDEE